VASFREAAGPDAKIAIFDDERAPLSDDCVRALHPDLRKITAFPRGGHLTGWSCVLGMLDCMRLACDELQEPGCVKIDSDTLVLGLDWLSEEAPLCGFVSGRNAYAVGMAYWIRRGCIEVVEQSLAGRWKSDAWRAPEDQSISTEALWRFGPACVLHPWDLKWAGGWQYGRVPVSRYRECRVITFGDRKLIDGCSCNNDRRLRAAMEMARFRHPVDNGPPA
jgi:hypothetical protein